MRKITLLVLVCGLAFAFSTSCKTTSNPDKVLHEGDTVSTRTEGWINDNKFTSLYDSKGELTETLWQMWTDDGWNYFSKTTYSYNNGYLTLEENRRWENNSWVNVKRSSYTYDNNFTLVKKVEQRWAGDKWINNFLNS